MTSLSARVVTTFSGVAIPAIGLGTFEPGPAGSGRCATAVKEGLLAGYRHVDTAALYGCEEEVGQGIRASGIPRQELVVCTNWQQYHRPDDVAKSLEDSLKRMQLEYGIAIPVNERPFGHANAFKVDLYLMHWPLAFKRTKDYEVLTGEDGKVRRTKPSKPLHLIRHLFQPVIDQDLSENHELTWRAMEALVRSGKARFIGVSNFTIQQLDKLLALAEVKPACNQVEAHPWFPQTELLEYCKSKEIALVAYSPLGSQPGAMHEVKARLLDDEDVVAVAEKNGCEPAQVLISWAIQRGTVVIPKSTTPSRIKANLNVPELSHHDFKIIDDICVRNPSKKHRFVNFDNLWGTSQFAEDA
ncbi:hypothetical protein ACJ41O_001467 [Fusarium nematophilum]